MWAAEIAICTVPKKRDAAMDRRENVETYLAKAKMADKHVVLCATDLAKAVWRDVAHDYRVLAAIAERMHG